MILYEMSNLVQSETGCAAVIFISPKGNAKHGPRVKVSNAIGKMTHDDTFTVSLDDLSIEGEVKLTAKQLNQVFSWIAINSEVIRLYWTNSITTTDMTKRIEKI